MKRASGQSGMSLLEVMFAMTILSIGLTWIIKGSAGAVRNATESRTYDAITELARSKMLDVEEQLLKDGFQETEQSTEGDFADEGWPAWTWEAKVEKAQLPSLERIQAMQAEADNQMAGAGTGSGTAVDPLQEAASGGGLMGMLSMLGGGDFSAEGAAGGSFIATQYDLIVKVFEASIRKVTLTVKWTVVGAPREMKVIAYFTDPAAMNRVIGLASGAGAGDYGTDGVDPTSTGTGTGTGATK